jgi:hypothetical protein
MTTIAWIITLVVAYLLGRWIENHKASTYWTKWHADKLETFAEGQRNARDTFEQALADTKQAWFTTVTHAYNAGIKEGKEQA